MSILPENKPILPVGFAWLAAESLGAEVAHTLFARIEKGRGVPSIRLNLKKLARLQCAGNMNDTSVDNRKVSCGGNITDTFAEELAGDLFGDNIAGGVKWCGSGFYLKERPQFTLDPLFHAGAYYVQEASSMYMEFIKGAVEREYSKEAAGSFFDNKITALDLCAAPGGKTTHLASLINDTSLLVANEVIRSRAVVLADNVARWGASNIMVSNNDPKDFTGLEGCFHIIVADVPCSGEGLFGKDCGAVEEWSLSNVKLCSERQKRILADIWPALKPGGFLVYSTCTYNHFENDDNIKYLRDVFGARIVELELPAGSGIISTPEGGAQFVPGLVEGEGQFVALLRKPLERDSDFWRRASVFGRGKSAGRYSVGRKGAKTGVTRGQGAAPRCPFLQEGYVQKVWGELVKGYPDMLADDILFFGERLRCLLSGTAIATVKGKDFIPHADLALSSDITGVPGGYLQDACKTLPGGILSVELEKDDALKFLAKEPLVFEGKPPGYLLLTYKGLGLGFVKNIGTRSNNLLPAARRIRMDIGGIRI